MRRASGGRKSIAGIIGVIAGLAIVIIPIGVSQGWFTQSDVDNTVSSVSGGVKTAVKQSEPWWQSALCSIGLDCPDIVTPDAQATPVQDDSTILKQLVSYDDSDSPGPTGDYYWSNGKARLDTGCAGTQMGLLSFHADLQGRSGLACGKLTYRMFEDSRGSRQGSPLDPPAGGWPTSNPKVGISYSLTGKTYNGYFYNRSHSIGDSLGGAQTYSSPLNFTAGSRPQNVGADQDGGMRAAEEKAEGYWKTHPGSSTVIDYETTPLYQGNEKIPRGSVVDVRSSDGALDFELVVINDAEGYTIDYNTGAVGKR